jgi:hypothetical protein
VIGYRDALDRASALTSPEQAAQLMTQARMVGDEPLGRAVAMQALDKAMSCGLVGGQAWAEIVNDWASTQPAHVDEALTELGSLHDAPAGIARSMAYSLATPSELDGRNITTLAAAADRHPGEDQPPQNWVDRMYGS